MPSTGGVNFSGLGSGIDFGSITDAIITQRAQPIRQLQTRRSALNARVDGAKQLNAKLIALTEAARVLKDRALGTGRVATSSSAGVLTATADASAPATDFQINVARLATNLTQASRSYSSSDAPILAGGVTNATFELRKGGAASGATVTIDASNNTLAGLRDAINAAGAGVTATVVDINGDGTNQQLVLTSTDTGAMGRVELVETSATGTGADLNLRSLNPPGAATDFSALDAELTLNGLTIHRATNKITDAVAGLTFELKGAGAATVGVSADTASVKDKLQAFVNAYNDAQDFINAQYRPDSGGRPSGVLAGESMLRSVQRQLRDALGASSTSNGGAFASLADIGVGRDNDGKLTLDTALLDNRLSSSAADVRALLSGKAAGDTGLASTIFTTAENLSDGISGVVQMAVNGYQSSIKGIEKSVSEQQARLELLRVSLTRQFAAVDAAIGQLNNQGTALTSVMKSLQSNGQ